MLDPYAPTEAGNASMLLSQFGKNLRFDSGAKVWMCRAAHYWRVDENSAMAMQALLEVAKLRKKLASETLEGEARERHLSWATKTEAFRVAQSSLKWAETMPEFAIRTEEWDNNPMLLGTPEGIYNLETGLPVLPTTLKREPYITKLTSVPPAPLPNCPQWLYFLDRVTQGDQELKLYLQRLAGYALTGRVGEQCLVWFIGDGGNGKSSFLGALTRIMGDYALNMRVEPLIASKHDVHPTELCDLRGKRLVITSETDHNREWREGLLKRLTGGDQITARRVHRDTITFRPTHKLIISGNHEPQLSVVSTAERRRYQMVPWRVNFREIDDPEFKSGDVVRDPEFDAKLEAEEYPAILRWAMEGTKLWLKHRLSPPEGVLTLTKGFLGEQDILKHWIDACCDIDPAAWYPSTDLFASWLEFTTAQREHPGTQRSFTERLKRMGYKAEERGKQNTRVVIGLKLNERAQRVDADIETASALASDHIDSKKIN